jgi:hypothetical protein
MDESFFQFFCYPIARVASASTEGSFIFCVLRVMCLLQLTPILDRQSFMINDDDATTNRMRRTSKKNVCRRDKDTAAT